MRALLEEAVGVMPAVFKGGDIVLWFHEHYPRVKESTVRAHVTCATVNLPSRRYCSRGQDLLFKRPDAWLERFDQSRHGQWKKGQEDTGDLALEEEIHEEVAAEASEPDRGLQDTLMQALGTGLEPRVVPLSGGVTHRFDFVGDGTVGVHGDREVHEGPGERWKGISEAVWLLQQFEGQGLRFLVFTSDHRTPTIWLDNLGRLCPDVEFFFLEGTRLVDLREKE